MTLVDWSPMLHLAVLGLVLAAAPLAWIRARHRGASPAQRLRALTLLTLFFTFDLIVIGATTRLTDSGLGCPDWPGCYGSASPLGAREEIHAAQTAMPTGPVTHGKAWMEMVHRYVAMGVGVLIIVIAAGSWRDRRRRAGHAPSPWWATTTLVAVCLQGAFGALTVTMKLYPAIVTLHLLFGLGLLALLAVQAEAFDPRPLRLSRALQAGVVAVALLSVLQIALGGWVSTNYAVLACRDFPTCQGSWWPEMDFEHAFTLRRELGQTASGAYLPFAALTAIHMAHRLMAVVVLLALGLLAWRLHAHADRSARRMALGLLAIMAWQFTTGLSNIVLGWPIVAAVCHTAGAAALVLLLARLMARSLQALPLADPSADARAIRAPA
ncbi:COX15/CtaA family protein [Aquincola sp. MAHUQ-54]|uniref:COX15/CtaA family protein n=1 Tax=Aquincola agrisoli TaxID=3119538 RepID=A0AAW9Q431_9BURK